MRVGDEAGRVDRRRRPVRARNRPRRVVVADEADERHAAAERRDVVRDVGRAAEPVFVAREADDRHRRFRRDAIDVADQEVIEHHVADDDDATAGEARSERHE